MMLPSSKSFMRILLAIDDSKCSHSAIAAAVQGMQAEGQELRLLHVVEPMWLVLDYETGALSQIEAAHQERMKLGEELLERVAPGIRDAGFIVSSVMEEGDARFVIVDHAVQWKADLIMLGSHGKAGLERLLLGSVSEYVLRHAHCSVMIVRDKSRETG